MYEIFTKLLKEKGVTVKEVCEATDIAESTMSMWKKRNTNLSFSNAVKLADYFGVPLEYFVTKREEK